jgi:[acyl-carrier-protein] S-malonyltransferase
MSGSLDLSDIPEELYMLMSEGPEEQLNMTFNAQPAVLAVSMALYKDSGLDAPSFVMGHSLGEYTALAASGSIPLQEAIRLVKKRGDFMQECPEGSMAAVIGLSEEELLKVIGPLENVWIANINGAGQIVISGKKDAVEKTVALLKESKVRAVPLSVSVASHCPVMEQARQKLSGYLKVIEIKKPMFPVVFNATARTESSVNEIKSLLERQLISPVRWEDSVRYVIENGVDTFIEIGPKPVLSPMIRRINPGVKVEQITVR